MLHSYLGERCFRVKIGNIRSSLKRIEAGVPQGSILSPTLFNIYMHDMPKAPQNAIIAQYADDTAILSRSAHPGNAKRRLQQVVSEIEEWYGTWRINVNATKSAAVHFTRKRKKIKNSRRWPMGSDVGQIKIFGKPVPWEKSAKYLGVLLDERLTWKQHAKEAVIKAKKAQGALYSLLNRRSKLSAKNKLLIYKTVIRPMMVYAAPIWGYAGSRVTKKMQVLQNQVLRMAVDAPWYIRNAALHADLKIPTVQDYVQKLAETFFAKAEAHDNETVVAALEDYDDEFHLQGRRPKAIIK